MMKISIDGSNYKVEVGERLIDVINRVGKEPTLQRSNTRTTL